MVSVFLHIAVFFLFHSNENPVFLSSPIEVSFYSLSSKREKQLPVAISSKKAWKQLKNNSTKEDIVVKKKADGLKPEKKSKVQNGNVETFQTPATDKLSVGVGSQYEGLSFDAKNFKYYYSYYSGQIIRKIRGQWRLGENYGKLRALVYFKIYRNGTISDIFVKESSKNGEYDRYALDTVRRAEPFPDLPDDYEGDSLGVFFEFKNGN